MPLASLRTLLSTAHRTFKGWWPGMNRTAAARSTEAAGAGRDPVRKQNVSGIRKAKPVQRGTRAVIQNRCRASSSAFASIGCQIPYARVPDSIAHAFGLESRVSDGKRHFTGVYSKVGKGGVVLYTAKYRSPSKELLYLGQYSDMKTAALARAIVRAACSKPFWTHHDVSSVVNNMCMMKDHESDWSWAEPLCELARGPPPGGRE